MGGCNVIQKHNKKVFLGSEQAGHASSGDEKFYFVVFFFFYFVQYIYYYYLNPHIASS